MLDTEDLAKRLDEFAPDSYTNSLIKASKAFDLAENDVCVAETVADTKIRNSGDEKLSEAKISSMIKKDKTVEDKKIALITAKAEFDSARLKRDDYLRKHDRDKKLADLCKVSY